MRPTPVYFFFLLLLCGMAGLYGQDGAARGRINLQGFVNPGGLRAGEQRQGAEGNNPGFDEQMSMIMAGADSVMEKTGNNTPLTPLGLPAGHPAGVNNPGFDEATGKIRAKIDSLQSRPDSLPLDLARGKKAKASGRVEKAEAAAGKITRKIDSLRAGILRGFGNPGGLRGGDKLGLGKVKVPKMKGVNGINNEMLKRVQHDILFTPGLSHPELVSGSIIPGGDLTERIGEQIRDLGGKVKGLGLGRSGRYDQYLGVGTKVKGIQQYSEIPNQVRDDVKGVDLSQIDQLTDAQASQMAELKELGAQTKELEALKGLPEDMLADLKRYQNEQALKEELKNRAVQKATDYLAGHMDKITQAQGAMSALKKKYSYVPDSRDLSTAVKNTSLKNEPLKRRFRYGLGWQIHRTDPVSLDLSPNLLYRFNKLFSAGISGTCRANLQIENRGAVAKQTVQDMYGVSAFAQYRLSFIKPGNKWLGSFFAHAEFEYMGTRPQGLKTKSQTAAPVEEPARTWNPGLPVGIGKQVRLSKALTGVIIFTYDVLHDEYSANPRAWNIKFGFRLGEI